MKLLHRTSRDFLLATAAILIATGFCLYILLKDEVQDEMEEQLAFQAQAVADQAAKGQISNSLFASAQATDEPLRIKPAFGDTQLYDNLQKKREDYLFIETVEDINGTRYKIRVLTTYVGWDKYYNAIFFLLLAAIVLLGMSGVLINYFLNKKVWKPFFLNLERLRNYSLKDQEPIELYSSSITEFKELRHTLTDMTERSRREYIALREFTENASHEIQTPLGIIQSKLDGLSQLEVSEKMAAYIVQAKSVVERLSRMNKNLLLLAKLDNQAFDSKKQFDLKDTLNDSLAMMEELFASKKLKVTSHLRNAGVDADPYLCDVLVNNLLSNALRYTEIFGSVNIQLTQEYLSISNQSKPLDFPAELLFNRFSKSSRSITSTGLGLAIAQQVCKLYGWSIRYDYENSRHVFQVSFRDA